MKNIIQFLFFIVAFIGSIHAGNAKRNISAEDLAIIKILSHSEEPVVADPNDLENLKVIDFRSGNIDKLSEGIGLYKNLSILSIGNGRYRELPLSIKKLKKLMVLDVNYSNLKNVGDDVSLLPLLTDLQLEYSEINDVPASLGNLRHLHILNLKGARVKRLPDNFKHLEKLDFIYLSSNLRTETKKLFPHIKSINERAKMVRAHAIIKRNTLMRIDRKEKITLIPKHNTETLNWIKKANNTDIDIADIPPLLTRIPNRIDFSIFALTQLNFKSLKDHSALLISLDYNELAEIPNWIFQQYQLRELDCDMNWITDVSEKIQRLKSLEKLTLSCNFLKTIPPELSKLKQLKHLDLSINNLTSIPPEIGDLENLEYLDLSGNRLTSIPANLKNLTSLKTIHVSQNLLPQESLTQLRSWFPNIYIEE